jgi:hypothetical protein
VILLQFVSMVASPAIFGSDDLPGSCAVDRDTWSRELTLRQRQELQSDGASDSRYRELAHDELRGVAAAVECYAAEHQAYPGAVDRIVMLSEIFTDLVPRYRTYLSTDDVWGKPLFYWSNGSAYAIISNAGSNLPMADLDQTVDRAIRDQLCSDLTQDDKRIVLVNGQFCRQQLGKPDI